MEVRKKGSLGNRDIMIDLIKGLGILCVVIGHCNFKIDSFLYLFHMAIFFMASGYFFSEKNVSSLENLIQYIKKRIKSIWLVYVIWMTIFSCLHNWLISINVYTDNPEIMNYTSGTYIGVTEHWSVIQVLKSILKSLLFRGHEQLGGTFWFLTTLFEVSILFGIISFLISKLAGSDHIIKIQGIISLMFLGIGYGLSLLNISLMGNSRIFSIYSLYYLGLLLKQFKINDKEKSVLKHGIVLVICFAILLLCNRLGYIALSANRYGNPLFLLCTSLTGWFFLYEMAYFIKKTPICSKLFVCLGQNSMAIMILHFLCFKLVSFIGIALQGKPWFCIAAFPVFYEDGLWWIPYTIIGVACPVLLNMGRKKIINLACNCIGIFV